MKQGRFTFLFGSYMTKEKKVLLETLRKYLEQDFLKAENFYQTRCTDYISPEEWYTEKINYVNRENKRRRALRAAEKRVLLKSLREHFFEQDFLKAYDFYQSQCANHISLDEYESKKIDYVQSWAERGLELTPDPEQAAAIGAVEGNVKVVARAGSGKTATLVNRAVFLQQHCGVDAEELLLLAFNKEAAQEMKARIGTLPHVMTFHALAYALVQPEKILLDEPEAPILSRFLQDVVDEYLSKPEYADQIRDLMMKHFRDDWEQHEEWKRIVSEDHGTKAEEILGYRRSLTRETLDGKYVKSFGEKVIANFLFEHGIEYKYEWRFRWNGRNYHPDFTIFHGAKGGIVIEYFGMKGDPDYDKMSAQKRCYWRNKPNWELIEFCASDLGRNGEEVFRDLLKGKLEDHGIQCNRLSEEQIWKQIKPRSIDRLTTVVTGFIQHCRNLALTPDELTEQISNHECVSEIEEQFLSLAQPLYTGYLKRLQSSEAEAEDFDGLLLKAVERVAAGKTDFKRKSGNGDLKQIRFVMIDEYQDFSELFYRLMEAVRKQNPLVRFFCVGDDWQAINGFAGSDLRFFQNFEKLFEDTHTLTMAKNYRSAPLIVDVGNALMQGRGMPARAHKETIGRVQVGYIDTLDITPHEKREHSDDKLTPAVLRLVNKAINNDQEVLLLSRKNSLPWKVHSTNNKLESFLALLRSRLPKDLKKKVNILTAHKSKGLQRNVVIVLDAVPKCYPVIHPNLIFTRMFGSAIEGIIAEERRLFYVALTRAEEGLFVLTEKNNRSPFLENLIKKKSAWGFSNGVIDELEWSAYPPPIVTIRVGGKGNLAIKDDLGVDFESGVLNNPPGVFNPEPMPNSTSQAVEAVRATSVETRKPQSTRRWKYATLVLGIGLVLSFVMMLMLLSKPMDSKAYIDSGKAKADKGQHLEAISDYDMAVRLNLDNARAYYYRGLAKEKIDRGQGREDLQKALKFAEKAKEWDLHRTIKQKIKLLDFLESLPPIPDD